MIYLFVAEDLPSSICPLKTNSNFVSRSAEQSGKPVVISRRDSNQSTSGDEGGGGGDRGESLDGGGGGGRETATTATTSQCSSCVKACRVCGDAILNSHHSHQDDVLAPDDVDTCCSCSVYGPLPSQGKLVLVQFFHGRQG